MPTHGFLYWYATQAILTHAQRCVQNQAVIISKQFLPLSVIFMVGYRSITDTSTLSTRINFRSSK